MHTATPAPSTLQDFLWLLSAAKNHWPQVSQSLANESLGSLLCSLQHSNPQLLFKAWTLGNEFEELLQRCCCSLSPQLVFLETSVLGQSAWTSVQPGTTARLMDGFTLQVRCWMLGATQYTWSQNGRIVESAIVQCTRHYANKSEICVQSGGIYECVAMSHNGLTKTVLQFEVRSLLFFFPLNACPILTASPAWLSFLSFFLVFNVSASGERPGARGRGQLCVSAFANTRPAT